MRTLVSQFLLLCICGIIYFVMPISTNTVIALLSVIITLTLSYFFSNRKMSLILILLYAVFSFIYKDFVFFFPMLFYLMGYTKYYHVTPLYLISMLCQFPETPQYFLLFIPENLLAVWLAYLTQSVSHLQKEYMILRDDATERNILLKERNRTLQKNQDYEIYNATLQERNRIAREIHDNVGHMLTRSILMLGALKTINHDENCSEPLTLLEDTLTQAMNNIRSSVHNLHDNAINLSESLNVLIQEYTFCDVSMQYDISTELPMEVRYAFLSIVKEALTNTSKHSNATRINILLREHPAMYQLIIHDNGTTTQALSDTSFVENHGIGLTNMRERIQKLGGIIQFHCHEGFKIFISIQKKEENP